MLAPAESQKGSESLYFPEGEKTPPRLPRYCPPFCHSQKPKRNAGKPIVAHGSFPPALPLALAGFLLAFEPSPRRWIIASQPTYFCSASPPRTRPKLFHNVALVWQHWHRPPWPPGASTRQRLLPSLPIPTAYSRCSTQWEQCKFSPFLFM
jgi:hypothetical protein